MIRKIKVLGLAFVAIMAFSSLVAAAAKAAEESVHIDANPAIVTGQSDFGGQHHVHTLQAGNFQITCTHATLEGTVEQAGAGSEQTPSDIEVTPTYSECEVFGFNATVDTNGCKYTITGDEAKVPSTTTAITEVTCSSTTGKQIQVTTGICTIDIPAQKPGGGHVVFSNNTAQVTSEKDMIANATVSGVTYTETGFFCPGGNNHETQDAAFAGETTVKAFEDTATQEELTQHGHKFTRHVCGAQVGIFAD
jgi:hypothetical protein